MANLFGFCKRPDFVEELIAQHQAPLFIISRDAVITQYHRMKTALPQCQIHYPVKALAQKDVISTLNSVGSHFEICSNDELLLTLEAGVPIERIIHTHPIKSREDILFAYEKGIRCFVVDSRFEINKFAELHLKDVRLLLRMSFRSEAAHIDLSWKFGVYVHSVIDMLGYLVDKKLNLAGLCFHTGSQNESSASYVEALVACAGIAAAAARRHNIELETIDIGGGFPVIPHHSLPEIEDFCQPIAEALENYFPQTQSLCEPGRFLVADAAVVTTKIIGKAEKQGRVWYYVDDGVYGSFSGKVYDQFLPHLVPLRLDQEAPKRLSVVAGPTCDSFDVIAQDIDLPELEIGDILLAGGMGAYSIASASPFNLVKQAKILILEDL